MLYYFLHFNQHAHTHPNKLHLNPHQLGFATQLQITPLSFPEWRDFVRVWSYSLAHHSALFGSTEAPPLKPLQPPRKHLLQTLQSQCLGHSQPQYKSNSSVVVGQKTHMRMGRRLVEGRGAGNREKKYWKKKRRAKRKWCFQI